MQSENLSSLHERMSTGSPLGNEDLAQLFVELGKAHDSLVKLGSFYRMTCHALCRDMDTLAGFAFHRGMIDPSDNHYEWRSYEKWLKKNAMEKI
jgi:hypothetical protein